MVMNRMEIPAQRMAANDDDDVVGFIADRLQAGVSPDQVRREIAGERFYVAKQQRLPEDRQRRIAAELSRRSVAEVAKAHNISRRTCYRIRARFGPGG
jgi:Mor family transcriptional regulator